MVACSVTPNYTSINVSAAGTQLPVTSVPVPANSRWSNFTWGMLDDENLEAQCLNQVHARGCAVFPALDIRLITASKALGVQ